MLDAKEITVIAGGKERLSNVSAEFREGEICLIVGPNGAGKSTLVKVLSGLIEPHLGTVHYDGSDVRKIPLYTLAKRRAVLSQAIEIAFPLSVNEVVMMGRYPHFGGYPRKVDESVVAEVMQAFEVEEYADRDYRTLSGGEQQRVNFARVLSQIWESEDCPPANTERYLFLDEPLTFLDIKHQLSFMSKIRSIANSPGLTTVGVVHDLNLAARFADKMLVLKDGRLVGFGPPREVLTEEMIANVFGVNAKLIDGDETGPIYAFG